MRVAFVSGHTDLTSEEFEQIYIPLLDQALTDGHKFVLGDARGVDTMAIAYLTSQKVMQQFPDVKQRLVVYTSRSYNVSKYEALGLVVIPPDDPRFGNKDIATVELETGVKNAGRDAARFRHLLRDSQLTRDSDYDILYVRSEDTARTLYGDKWRPRISATELNRQRRLRLGV